jgi:Mg-chelatase subunit ChlD
LNNENQITFMPLPEKKNINSKKPEMEPSDATTEDKTILPQANPAANATLPESKANITSDIKIVMILDASGSMKEIRFDMIGSINTFIEQQKELRLVNETATFSLFQFGQVMRWIYFDVPLAQIMPLSAKQYEVTGSTPLYDSIGDVCTKFEAYRDVIIVIVTDGQENVSKRFTQSQIKKLIAQRTTEVGWEFIYLSCDAEGFAAGNALGMNDNMQVEKRTLSGNVGSHCSSGVCERRKVKSGSK